MFNVSHFHPMTVHFPIAIILLGMLCEVASLIYTKEVWLKKASFYLMIIGSLSALAALGTGYLFTEEPTEGALSEIVETHEHWALASTIIVCCATLLRGYITLAKNETRWLSVASFALLVVAVLAISWTGYLGGTVVYDYMTGV